MRMMEMQDGPWKMEVILMGGEGVIRETRMTMRMDGVRDGIMMELEMMVGAGIIVDDEEWGKRNEWSWG